MAKSFWDEFKDLFKTDAQRAEEKQQQINDALEREKDIADRLAELEKEYINSLPKEEEPDFDKLFPTNSGLKEIDYTKESDEDIVTRAEKENKYNKNAEQNKLADSYKAKLDALTGSKQQAGENLRDSYKQLQELYDELRSKTENDVLKRGLARSSIAVTQLGDLDSARLTGVGELRKSYNETMNDIDIRIGALEADRENALNELDLKYATELDNRISELKTKRDKTVKEYEEYNAKVRKQNEQYEKQRENDIADYLEKAEKKKKEEQEAQAKYESQYGYSGAKQENYAKRYDIAFDFYSSLSPDIAADALAASPNMKYYLGNYYDKLMSTLKSSQSGIKKVF